MRRDGPCALLELERLAIRYASGPLVLEDVNLCLQHGESAGLAGASGSGKTTLTRALLGLLPDGARLSGHVRFDGVDLTAIPHRGWQRLRGARIALLSQEPSLSLTPHRRVGAQITEVMVAHERATPGAALDQLAMFFGAAAARIARAYPHELSGGERQRAAIARAVCCKPDLLIADEPTASLDSVTQRDVLDTLRKLNSQSGMALLLISHQPRVISYTTSRCWRLDAGRVAEAA